MALADLKVKLTLHLHHPKECQVRNTGAHLFGTSLFACIEIMYVCLMISFWVCVDELKLLWMISKTVTENSEA